MAKSKSIIGCVRLHWLIWSWLLFFQSMYGQAAEIKRQLNSNFLYTDSYAVMPGDSFEMTLNIFLEDLARGFQFDISMPSEFTLDFSGVTEDPVLAPFSVSSSDLGSGNYRFVVFSLGSDVLPVGDYPVFYLPITVSASAAAGTYDFPLDNVTISGMNNQNIATPASIIGQVEIVGNSPPVAQNQSVTMSEDSQLDIILIATDPEGDPLTYTIVTQPANGTAVLTGNTVDYTPDANYNGPDSFTFTANDGTTDSNVATVSIDVLLGLNEYRIPPKISPNPFNNRVFIELEFDADGRLFDISGKFVKSFKLNAGSNTVFLDNLSNGIYFMRLDNDYRVFVTRLIKE